MRAQNINPMKSQEVIMKQLNYVIIYIFSLVPLTIFAERHYINMKITAVIPERVNSINSTKTYAANNHPLEHISTLLNASKN